MKKFIKGYENHQENINFGKITLRNVEKYISDFVLLQNLKITKCLTIKKLDNIRNLTITGMFQHQNLTIIDSFAVTEVVSTSDNC